MSFVLPSPVFTSNLHSKDFAPLLVLSVSTSFYWYSPILQLVTVPPSPTQPVSRSHQFFITRFCTSFVQSSFFPGVLELEYSAASCITTLLQSSPLQNQDQSIGSCLNVPPYDVSSDHEVHCSCVLKITVKFAVEEHFQRE